MAMRSYLARRADASTLAAVQPSGLLDDIRVGFHIPPACSLLSWRGGRSGCVRRCNMLVKTDGGASS
eukprot:4855218-Alexandrium_andersonii.AAC.1